MERRLTNPNRQMECIYRSEEAFLIDGRGYVLPGMPERGWPMVGMTLDSNDRVTIEHLEYLLVKAPKEKLGIVLEDIDGEHVMLSPGRHRFCCPASPANLQAVRVRLDQALRYSEAVLRDNDLENLMGEYETSPALADRVDKLRANLGGEDCISELFGIFGPTGQWDDLGAPSLPANEVCELLTMIRKVDQTGRYQ